MDVGIIVFGYNRSSHLKQVLDGLKENEGVSQLYIFQDGLKCKEHRSEWEKTQQVIKSIDWCEVQYELSPYNKGVANSITDGIKAVFEKKDAVIVLEDDCVPTMGFISFMQQCFEKYKDDKRVYSVSGYAWPIDLPKDKYDIYGCGRISSWGWGTWKDRWEHYKIDNNVLERIKADKHKLRCLMTWGNDLEPMLAGKTAEEIDSWAVNWALSVIENEGVCINPYKSMIQNIGMDSMGVHCGITDKFQVEILKEFKLDFILPDNLNILYSTEKKFKEWNG